MKLGCSGKLYSTLTKIHFMNPIHSPMTLLIFCTLLFGCTKSTQEQVPLIESNLSADTNFIKVVDLEQGLNHFVLQLATSKGLTMQAFKIKIQDLNDKDLHSTKDHKLFNEYIGSTNIEYLNNYIKTYHSTWSKLNAQYNYISMQNINEACKQLYVKRYNSYTGIASSSSSLSTHSNITINRINDCGWRFSLCMAAATAGAILCHASCIGATAGLGTPACVVLCATLEAAAGVVCIDNYCPIP